MEGKSQSYKKFPVKTDPETGSRYIELDLVGTDIKSYHLSRPHVVTRLQHVDIKGRWFYVDKDPRTGKEYIEIDTDFLEKIKKLPT